MRWPIRRHKSFEFGLFFFSGLFIISGGYRSNRWLPWFSWCCWFYSWIRSICGTKTKNLQRPKEKKPLIITYRLVDVVVVLVVADFNEIFDWLDIFVGLADGVFLGDFDFDRLFNDDVELLVPGAILLIAPVLEPIGGIPTTLFCRGGEHPK